MTEIRDRFHDLDGLAVPDVYARARAMGPKEPQEPRPPAARRVGVILLASLVAIAGFGLLLRARGSEEGTPGVTTSTTAAPGPRGLVAFAAQLRGSTTGLVIAVMRPDGTGFRQLTGLPADRQVDPLIAQYSFASDDSPSFSPDGRTIAFVRAYAEGIDSLCMIDVDGSNFRVVKRDAQMGEIAWSPDGRSIAFYSEKDGGIHLVNADGTNERTLWPRTGGPNQDAPSWSPDSSQVYFVSGGVWVADVDGSRAREIIGILSAAGWVAPSPDGSMLAVMEASTDSIWVFDSDGANGRHFTPVADRSWVALTWSPDGSELALVANDGSAFLTTDDGSHVEPLHLPDRVAVSGAIAWSGT